LACVNKALRILVLLRMAATVPLQAFAAAAGVCLGVHDEPSRVVGAQPDDAPTASAVMAHSGDQGRVMTASHHGHHPGVHGHHDVNDKCGVCCACGASMALAPQHLGVPAVRSSSEAIPFRPAAIHAAYLALLERPPKHFL
jgi:hypothetical protein